MSILLEKYFENIDNIQSKEFLAFFGVTGTQAEKQELLDKYYSIRQQNDGVVDFSSITEQTKNYQSLFGLLTSIEHLKTNLDQFVAKTSNHNKLTFVDATAELMLLLDIHRFVKLMTKTVYGQVEKYYEMLRIHALKSDAAKKRVQQLIADTDCVCQDPVQRASEQVQYDGDTHRHSYQQGQASKKGGATAGNKNQRQDDASNNQSWNANGAQAQRRTAQSALDDAKAVPPIAELQEQINNLKQQVNQMRFEYSHQVHHGPLLGAHLGGSIAPLYHNEPRNLTEERSELLTNSVWPKPRMLLAIVSKMSKEGLLNPEQKGALKDLIIENDQRILNHLREYQFKGDRKSLYDNFLALVS